jgi:uncharacterized integral membrane protein
MLQLNFVIIFVISLAFVLFGIENTEPAVIHIVRGVQIQAPLSIELILAMGIGAVLAWVFSVWTGLQDMLEARKTDEQIEQKEQLIHELEQNIEEYKAEILEQRRLLPARETLVAETEAS